MSFEWVSQQKIFEALNGNISCDVYDVAPQGAQYPHADFGETISSEGGTSTETSKSMSYSINIWARQNGSESDVMQVKKLQDEVFDALHLLKFSEVGFSFTENYSVSTQNFKDIDGVTRHGVQEFQFNIEKV